VPVSLSARERALSRGGPRTTDAIDDRMISRLLAAQPPAPVSAAARRVSLVIRRPCVGARGQCVSTSRWRRGDAPARPKSTLIRQSSPPRASASATSTAKASSHMRPMRSGGVALHRLPEPELARKDPPRDPSPVPVDDALGHLPMITKRATHRPLYCRQQPLDPVPQLVGQHSAAHPTACPGPAHTSETGPYGAVAGKTSGWTAAPSCG
jgi:hypothetical protein